ncbi:glycosyltransferase family 2 protein [soil metagenome]
MREPKKVLPMVSLKVAVPKAPSIDIVMATYNGSKYLPEQLDSLLAQSWKNIRILVSDDGSTDNTLEILNEYGIRFPGLFFVEQNPVTLGPIGNFVRLMERTTADYVAFCDQDDIWLTGKLAQCMVSMLHIEIEKGHGVPVLVYTDMKLTSSDGTTQAESHWEKAGIRPRGASFKNLLAQNLVTGCTMLANRALINLAIPMPVKRVMMHDYWLALIASAFGVLHPIHKQTVLYRQHENNAVGAGRTMSIIERLDRLRNDPKLENWLCAAGVQADAFLEAFGNQLTPKDQHALRSIAGLYDKPWIMRNFELARHGVRRTGLLNHLQFVIRL